MTAINNNTENKAARLLNQVPGYEDVRQRASCILNLDMKWRLVVRFTLQPLFPKGKRHWYPLDKKLGGLQSRSGSDGNEKNPWLCGE
jgi:hypothetical protein